MSSHDLFAADDGHQAFLSEVKQRVQQARTRAILSVNRELIVLYWHLGREILFRQNDQG